MYVESVLGGKVSLSRVDWISQPHNNTQQSRKAGFDMIDNSTSTSMSQPVSSWRRKKQESSMSFLFQCWCAVQEKRKRFDSSFHTCW
mmetsp:Transcript_20151/g.29905  ORF Transcript_20151/g.29905 Transcript_20151/m.29905 type:complete len:87 (+) Transcript_20151:553-813(+)